MHVGLNLVFLVPGETGGMEVAARELLPALLAAAPPDVSFTAFVNRETAGTPGPWTGDMRSVTIPVHARNRAQWVMGEQTALPMLARKAGVELLHSLASTAPLWGPFRRVLTVHDLIYARFPDAHRGIRDKGMRLLVPAAARRSDRVIAISASTREDLISMLGLPAELIDVVPQGLGTVQRVAPLGAAETRARFGLGERPVLLTLSARRAHKNLERLIGALAAIPVQRRPLLVLPGYATDYEARLRAEATTAGVTEDVRFIGWVQDAELEGLWAVARAFVFPSLYEGFGLPVLEAMARGVPVACADTSSLPEVAGGAALLFDPLSERDIADAIVRLLDDQDLRVRLVQLGRERARLFSWERTAAETLAVYERTLGRAPRSAGARPEAA